jgi:hypothetical protein
MALQKTFEQPTGVSPNYIKVMEVNIAGGIARAQVVLFLNAAARAADKNPISLLVYSFPMTLTDLDAEDNNPFKLTYEYLKTLPEYDGATDV